MDEARNGNERHFLVQSLWMVVRTPQRTVSINALRVTTLCSWTGIDGILDCNGRSLSLNGLTP